MDLLHQRLKRAPANLAEVPIVVRHKLSAVAGAVHADMGPSEIVVGFAETTIAEEGSFRSHPRIRAVNPLPRKKNPFFSRRRLEKGADHSTYAFCWDSTSWVNGRRAGAEAANP